MTYKRTQVIMLPTNNIIRETRLGYYQDVLSLNNTKYDESLILFRTTDGIEVPNPQHLYIISDDEIKEGDWYCSPMGIISRYNGIEKLPSNWRKIIATTEESSGLPQPSKQFIEKYIEEYNKGNIITDVLVEYNICSPGMCLVNDMTCGHSGCKNTNLKVNSNNEIL